jgi:hypothetical protein
MPINPNIALGVQQQQPVNMLGQMGQIYALKGAKQELEGNEALREFYASGGDLSKAEDRQRLMSMAPMQGQKLIGQESERRARDVGTIEKRQALFTSQIKSAITPEHIAQITQAMYADPDVGPMLTRIRPLNESLASIPTDPKGIEEYRRRMTLGADNLFESANAKLQAQVSREGHGVQMRGQNMTSQTAANLLDFNTRKRSVIPGDNQYYTTGAFGDVQPVTGYGTSAPALPPAAANAFVTIRPPVNKLGQTPSVVQPGSPTVANAAAPSFVQPGSPTRANAAAIEAQQNIPRPPARAGYKYNEQGQLVKVLDEKPVWNDKAQVWMTPPTAENPQGTVTEAPAVQKTVQERTANATLKVAGYDPKTQTDEVSRLIKQSTSGLAENWANKVWSAISGTGSKGAEAIAQLETRANEMTLALAPNGSLGAGFSNEDRTFMLGKLGDVANPDKPMNVRLAAWEDVMERTARTANVPYTKQSFGSSNASSAKTVTKTGTFNGRKVVQYSDGTTAYAD